MKHFISRDYKPIINGDDVKISFNFLSEEKYVESSDTSAGTDSGNFNNSTNVTHTQIQTDDDDIIYELIAGVIRKIKYIGHVDD